MTESEELIKKQLADIKSDFSKTIDLYERGNLREALELSQRLPAKLFSAAQNLSTDYFNVLQTRHLKGSDEVQGKIDALLKDKEALGKNPNEVIKILLTMEGLIRKLDKETAHNYPALLEWIKILNKRKKPLIIFSAVLVAALVGIISVHHHQAKIHGLVGTYFKDQNLSRPFKNRIDSIINFNWQRRSPIAGIPAKHFSIRWEGYLDVPQSGTYDFLTQSDDGVRLYLGGKLLIDDWRGHAVKENSAQIKLNAGYYPIKLDYFQDTGPATIKLFWRKSSEISKELINSKYFISEKKYLDINKAVNDDIASMSPR